MSSAIKFGRRQVTNTPVKIVEDDMACSAILLIAPLSNTASIFVGAADVNNTTTGIELEPGAKIPIPLSETKRLHAVTSGTQSLSYIVRS